MGEIMIYLRIGICDDEELQLDTIYNIVNDNFKKLDCDFEIIKSINPKYFIETYYQENFDIVFLDIDMPEISGIDIAKLIKLQNSNTMIIFVTSKDDLVYESLKAQPFRFIRKSKLKEEISEAILAAYKQFDIGSYKINIRIDNKDYNIDINNILYIESNRNYIIIKTINHREFKYKDSINKKEKDLDSHGFIRTHFGYLVNQKYVYCVKDFSVILKDNIKVPVSRSRKQFVQQKLLEFLR